jgi:hypothetical protein
MFLILFFFLAHAHYLICVIDTDSYTNADSHANADTHAYSHSDTNTYTDSNSNPNAYSYTNPYSNAHACISLVCCASNGTSLFHYSNGSNGCKSCLSRRMQYRQPNSMSAYSQFH